MRRPRRYDVCASVISDLQFDARVWKEARSLSADGRSVLLIGPVFDVDHARRRMDSSGVDVHEIPMGWRDRPKSRRERLAAAARVWLRVLLTNARAYHAHDIHVGPPAWLGSRLRGATLVYDAHELWHDSSEEGLRARVAALGARTVQRFMVHVSDAVITTNRSRAEVLTERYGRKDILVLANVPLLEREISPDGGEFPPGKRVILYVGWIAAFGRPFKEMIEALPKLDDDVDLVILGFGWDSMREQIRAWARERGVADRVHFLAPRPFDELVAVVAAATVGIVPLYAFPINNLLGDTNKLFEYLMGGLPVVASDLPEVRRVVSLGDPPVGELFEPTSPESIARAVRAVIDDPRYGARRAQARKLAEERFNWGIEERQLTDLYDRFLGAQRAEQSGSVARP